MISHFSGPHRFLSNFHPSPIVLWRWSWPTVEHAYQAAKTEIANWPQFEGTTAGQAKRLGRRLRMSPNFDTHKLAIMGECLAAKFSQNPHLCIQLLDTHPHELVEGNTWGDTFWGVCDGVGENHLGKLLMRIRKELMP